MEPVEHFVHAGEGVGVLDGDGVEGAVVHAKPEGTVFLADEEDGGAERGDGRADVAAGEEVGELAAELLELVVGEGLHAEAVGWGGAGEEVNGVVNGTRGWEGEGVVVGRDGGGVLAFESVEPRGSVRDGVVGCGEELVELGEVEVAALAGGLTDVVEGEWEGGGGKGGGGGDDVVLAVVVDGDGAGGPVDVGVAAVEPGGPEDKVEPFEGCGVE
jgi:hypothetical protein